MRVHDDPAKYDDPRVWRYWSPDGEVVTPTRGHIFLLHKPALDMKIHPDDALPNMGVRPCVKQVPIPEVSIVEENNALRIVISK